MALAVKYKAYIVSGNFKQDLFPVCGSETDAQNFIDGYEGKYDYGVIEPVYVKDTSTPATTTIQ